MAYTAEPSDSFPGWTVVEDGRTVAVFREGVMAKSRAERYANRKNAEMILRWFHSYPMWRGNVRYLGVLVELADRFLDGIAESETDELERSIEAVRDLIDRAGTGIDVDKALNWGG